MAVAGERILDVMNNRFRLTTSEKLTQQDFLNECRSLVFEYRNDSSGEAEYAVAMGEIAVKTNGPRVIGG